MKAILLNEYGPPKTLEIGEAAKPVPKDGEVLVKIHSTAINDWDWGIVRGNPFIIRMFFGLWKPKVRIPGIEISGTVEEVDDNVSSFTVGVEVYCDLSDNVFGGFAEYVCIPEKSLYQKPANISHLEASALPHAGLLVLQSLDIKGEVKPGQRVLINGAGGGVGTLGVQILKPYGVTMTGVDSGEKLELMKSMGYDHVMDYKKTDFTTTGEKYDFILDTKSNRSVFKYARSLKKGGTYVTVGGVMYRIFQIALLGWLIKLFTGKKLSVLGLQPNQGLERISELAEKGQLKPVIEGPYAFDEIPELIQYFGEARHKGKVVVDIET
ncbi:NAD(P)-dependent alcohol dehydrogenase [Rhodohalobacter mucosus]|uniref:Alcohol dehydrogenase n=1 Tax=Rhodohalobacter mucosus TaxID=2079485 RepID=A0A316TST8_9BACT|nr:NAD(P)-dependent alcohol dehydrogenase [Rhodohalobacter mucosus]PWN06025.1 alcohol dehydrogenase [Rhodohalobacter mucosus]